MATYFYREYGRALRGQKVEGKISGKKYERTSIVAGKCTKNIIAPLQYSGTMDSFLFEFWFKEMLLKEVPKGYTVVMDNCSVHRKPQLFKLAEKAEVNLIFLPPYSPDLNPIENFWAWLKLKLRSILHKFSNFDQALSFVFNLW